MNSGAGEGKLPEVSPELTRLRVIVEIRKKDLRDAIAKMEEARKEGLKKLDELKTKELPTEFLLSKMFNEFEKFIPQVTIAEEAATKLISAYEDLTRWYEKSLLGKE